MAGRRRGVTRRRPRRDQIARPRREERRPRGRRGPRGPGRGRRAGGIRPAATRDNTSLMAARKIDINYSDSGSGWLAHGTVTAPTKTSHVVRVSPGELERYGGGELHQPLRRSFEFLLDTESNTSILPE